MSERLPRWLVPVACAAVAAPILVAGIAQHGRGWHPVFDLAMTEVRVRDVGTQHTPLVGLQGRIGPTGSHPGPISFYLLAPVYRLAGSTSFALQLATAVFHAAAGVAAVLVASRWRDARVVAGVAIAVLLLVQGYGMPLLVEPWNPHLPVLWFFTFLVAAWAVTAGDVPMLVPAVVAASICAQTHVPYLAITLGIGGVLVGVVLVRWRRGDHRAPRWLLLAAAAGLVLWAPPLIDQVARDGNLGQIIDHLGTPEEDPIGVGPARRFVVERMDAWQLVVGESQHPGTYGRVLSGPGPEHDRGVASIIVWLAAVAVAVVLRQRALLALHLVVAAAGALAIVAISRIHGIPWPYLMFWVFGITALTVLGIAGAPASLLDRSRHRDTARRWTAVAALVAVAALSVRLVLLAPDARTATAEQTGQLARIVAPTVDALEAGAGAASGGAGRYLVTWSDGGNGGALGLGMVNELMRHGYDVGVAQSARVQIGPRHVRTPEEATAEVVVVTGGAIDRTAERPGAARIAFDDPRTAGERADFEEARQTAIRALEDLGRSELIPQVDSNLFGLALNEGLPPEVTGPLARMLDVGVAVAVFVVPTGPAP